MYLSKQNVQAVRRKARSEQGEMSLMNLGGKEAGPALSYSEVCIQYSLPPQKEETEQEMLNQRFLVLEREIMEIFSEEERKSKIPHPAIRLWRELKHKRKTEGDLNKLEEAIPRIKKRGRGTVKEISPEPSSAAEVPDPKDEAVKKLLGTPDTEHSYATTCCQAGSMLIDWLVSKGIIKKGESISIGHQTGHCKGDKRFVVVIRGQYYHIFGAQHPGENNKEYEVHDCRLSSLEYPINLEGKRIKIGKKGFELSDGRQI